MPFHLFNKSKVLFPVFFALALSLCVPVASFAEAEKAPEREVVAKVNGVPIYLDQIQGKIREEARKYQRQMGSELPADLQARIRQKALVPFVEAELIYQEAKKQEIPDLEKQVEARVQSIKEEHPDYFKERGEEDTRAWARRQIILENYFNELKAQTAVSDEELRELYEKQKDSFRSAETVHVRHIIVVIPEDGDEAKKKQALEKIREARKKIVEGAPFAEVAKEYSEDNVAQGGGDMGFVRRGYMPKEFEQVAFSIEPGQLSEVIETRHGYHVLEVIEKSPAGQIPLEGMRDFLTKFIEEQKRQEVYKGLVARLKEKADIQILMQ